jgi:hypothetical protein
VDNLPSESAHTSSGVVPIVKKRPSALRHKRDGDLTSAVATEGAANPGYLSVVAGSGRGATEHHSSSGLKEFKNFRFKWWKFRLLSV